jgi:hypothetical protein
VVVALSTGNFAMFLIAIIVLFVVLKKRQKMRDSKDKKNTSIN